MISSHRQEFCVRWNSHLGSIGAAFPQLLAGQRFVDVTLACEGHQVHCHRLVLAACSSYFESILAENPCKHPVIILPSEIKLWEIQALVDFMYKGEVNVTQSGLPQLLRCAEQLRIRGLYGSDAALNLNQLKALSQKVPTANNNINNNCSSGVSINEPVDEDTATSSTVTSLPQHQSAANNHIATAAAVALAEQYIKKEPISAMSPATSMIGAKQQLHELQQHQQNLHNQQQQQQQQQPAINVASLAAMMANPASTSVSNTGSADDESGDDSNSNTFEQYEAMHYHSTNAGSLPSFKSQQQQQQQQSQQPQSQSEQHQPDSMIEDDHNYVGHDEEDSFGNGGGVNDNELDTSANNINMQASLDANTSYKRVRRSEACLAQAAKCVSKGQTFQTVSNIFNIPVSTIRFYMARKGILPKRKRGRGAASNMGVNISRAVAATNVAEVMSQALAHIKGAETDGVTHLTENSYNAMNYNKLEPPSAATAPLI